MENNSDMTTEKCLPLLNKFYTFQTLMYTVVLVMYILIVFNAEWMRQIKLERYCWDDFVSGNHNGG